MKIALITYHHTYSYGASLQTYATIKALESLGYEVWLVNLHIPQHMLLIRRILMAGFWLKQWRFRQKYFKHVTRRYKDSEDLRNNPPMADLYMTGSDQTWNPGISQQTAPSFFLDFVKDNSKKVTYAASFGFGKIEDSKWMSKEEMIAFLRQYDRIAIRESSGKEMLSQIGIESTQVLDPVLLFPRYDEFITKPKQTNEIVVFRVSKYDAFCNRCKSVGLKVGCPVRCLGSLKKVLGTICPYPNGIEKWVSSIASAKYVITDSFHGLVISLLYHKPFVILPGYPERMDRLRSLLQQVGLEDRIMSLEDSTDSIIEKLNSPIDYAKVDAVLSREREESYGYLKSLGKAK